VKKTLSWPKLAGLSLLFFLTISVWSQVFRLTDSDVLKIVVFDVGQGDAIFIQSPQGHQILIDGGFDQTVLSKLNQQMPFWDRSLDLIVLTHPEKDHLVGLIEVLKSYRVENILWTGVVRKASFYEEWQRLIQEEEANIILAEAGKDLKMGEVYFDILYPFQSLNRHQAKDLNRTSIVMRGSWGQNSILLTGDIPAIVERELLASLINVESDILKVAHHGSKGSSQKSFLQAVNPIIGVISLGDDNHYGHPAPETIANLEEAGVNIFRTDQDGDVEIKGNGQNHYYKIKICNKKKEL
jgi:competence protein ComEC